MGDLYINHWAVFVCAIVNIAVGALWYSPLMFYKAWKSANNLSDDDLKKANLPKMHITSFILSLIISYNLAFFLGDANTDWSWGLSAGFMAGLGWAAAIFAIIALFEQKSWKYIFINAGYIVVYFTIVGFILGLWR